MADIICSGFGGQGVLSAGLILANAAMDLGKEVTWIPSYGSEMRGGTAGCAVRIADGRIGTPFIRNMDLLIAMNPASVDRYQPLVRPGGIMIVNGSLMPDGYAYRDDIQVHIVPAVELARRAENPKGLNLVMLAAGVTASGLLDFGDFAAKVDAFFAKKGKVFPKNAVCLELGRTAVA